jgi:Replication-relaxation
MTAPFPVQIGPTQRRLSPTTRECPRPLSERDVAILLAIDQYRYLDRDHVTDLFFSSRRYAEIRLKDLLWRGLVHRWPVMRWQGSLQRPAVYALTSSGARQIAMARSQDPRPLCNRARRAREQTYHLRHDLEANSFFTKLAAAGARELPEQGLYHWVGETTCRAAYEREGRPPSDGWGRYLLPDREITFDLEWDRGTEYPRRIRTKANGYITYFGGRRRADLHHVLFVAPTRIREGELHDLIGPLLPPNLNLCRFWTTAVETVSSTGWLGAAWLEIGGPPQRFAFADMPGFPRGQRPASDCIGKPEWWKRRRSGGEGA